jgi:hypothetical protein
MVEVQDYNTDPNKVIAITNILGKDNIPDFVKNASAEATPAGVSSQYFADQGKLGGRFPMSTPAETYMSAAYFMMQTLEGMDIDPLIYQNIKTAALIHDNNAIGINVSGAIDQIEVEFKKKAAAMAGPKMNETIRNGSGKIAFNVTSKNDLPAIVNSIERNYNELTDFDKYAMIANVEAVNQKHNLGLDLRIKGISLMDCVTKLDLEKVAGFILNGATIILPFAPDEAKFLSQFALSMHQNAEALSGDPLIAKIVKVASQVKVAVGAEEDLLTMTQEEAPKESFVSIDGEAFSEQDFNKVAMADYSRIFGESFADNIKAADDTVDIGKIQEAVTTMNDNQKTLLKLLVSKYR